MSTLIAIAAVTLMNQGLVRVTPTGLDSAREPQVAIDSDNRVFMAYGVGNAVFVSISLDEGKSYGTPILVGAPGKLSLGMHRGPRVTAHKGVVTVTAIFGLNGRGQDGDLVAFRSKDSGKTWSGPVRVNDVESSAREGLHAMAVAPDGSLACAWLDLRERGTKLYLSSSKDGGETWSPNVAVYESPSGTICECCHPSLAFDRSGKLHVLFRNSVAGDRDMYLLDSSDMRRFSSAVKLGQASWKLQACPMDGGMLAVSGQGAVETVWRREGSIYTSKGPGAEVRLAEGKNPWMAALKSGFAFTWQNGKAVMLATPGQPLRTIAEEGSSPVITTSPGGSWGILAWSNRGIESTKVRS